MKRVLVLIGIGTFPAAALAVPAHYQAFQVAYPQARAITSCKVCHDSWPSLNYYGLDFQKAKRDFKAVEPLDSDGDGVNNIDEINSGSLPGEK